MGFAFFVAYGRNLELFSKAEVTPPHYIQTLHSQGKKVEFIFFVKISRGISVKNIFIIIFSRPAHSKVINTEDGGYMKFNQEGNLVAIMCPLAFNFKVFQLQNSQLKLNVPVLLPTNVTWHFRLPVVCIGDDRDLCFWKIDPN